jgi:hypothetical protein
MIKRELAKFGKFVLALHVLGFDEEKLAEKALKVVSAVAELEALRAETSKESPWRLSRRRSLEKVVEDVIPAKRLTWGMWGAKDPYLLIDETPVPVIEALGPPRLVSPKVAKELATKEAYLDARRAKEV